MKRLKLYIGIDLGNDCGYAVLKADGTRVESGTWLLKPGADEMKAARWLKFAKSLRALLDKYKTNNDVTLTYEFAPHQKGHHAAFIYGGWLAMLEIAEAEHKSVRWQRISVADWKKAVVGNGRAKKPAYIAAINKLYKLKLTNRKGGNGEDEAAALGVARASILLREQLAAG